MALDNSGSTTNGHPSCAVDSPGSSGNQMWWLECAGIPQTRTGATSYNSASPGWTDRALKAGQDVSGITNGSYTAYNNLNMSGVHRTQGQGAARPPGGALSSIWTVPRARWSAPRQFPEPRSTDLDHGIMHSDALQTEPINSTWSTPGAAGTYLTYSGSNCGSSCRTTPMSPQLKNKESNL